VIEIHESTGCYAIDALDQPELAVFEAHLANCFSCEHEVADFYEAAAELTMLAASRPPLALRDTVLSAVRNTPQLPTSTPVNSPAAPPRPHTGQPSGPRRALPGTEVVDEPDPPTDEQLALRRQWRRNRLLTGAVAAMLALLVGLGGVAYSQFQQRQAQVAQMNLENELYGAPDTETVVVEASGGGRATFVVSRQLNRALFIGTNLPDPGPDRRYQLWTTTGGPTWKTASGIFRDNQIADTGPGSKAFFKGDIARAEFLCLNVEPLSNTTGKPTTPVLASGKI
jgi:anti-sigma-K factor RskA